MERIEDPERLAAVRALPCLCCLLEDRVQDSPTESHHIKRKADGSKYGMSEKAHDHETIPLCAKRHHWNGGHCQHPMGSKAFEARYGNERDLLHTTDVMLGLT